MTDERFEWDKQQREIDIRRDNERFKLENQKADRDGSVALRWLLPVVVGALAMSQGILAYFEYRLHTDHETHEQRYRDG